MVLTSARCDTTIVKPIRQSIEPADISLFLIGLIDRWSIAFEFSPSSSSQCSGFKLCSVCSIVVVFKFDITTIPSVDIFEITDFSWLSILTFIAQLTDIKSCQITEIEKLAEFVACKCKRTVFHLSFTIWSFLDL